MLWNPIYDEGHARKNIKRMIEFQRLGRFDPMRQHLVEIEVPNTMFLPYLYESQGIEIPLSTSKIDKIFWDAASPGVATEGMKEFLT